MIYLIDDKEKRQEKDFGWTAEKFGEYSSFIECLYTIEEIANVGDKLYDDNNVILYHESFLDFTDDRDKSVTIREKLKDKAKENNALSVAFFSGSQSSRSLNKNVANLPVAILYQNLEILIKHHKSGKTALEYLLFGERPEIEKYLDEKLTEANKRNIESKAVFISGNNLLMCPDSKYIQNAIEDSTEKTLFLNVSDENLSKKIQEWCNQKKYDNIFIPLCFGEILSDYNGLRLATHIRCTPSLNQLSRIFIYSFVDMEYLLHDEYFNILQSKNVHFVNHSKEAFQKAANASFSPLKETELAKEIKKLALNPPNNYFDNHSITNEYAIHQWAKTIGCEEDEALEDVFKNVNNNLYFKYLRTINPIYEIDRISKDKLKIDNISKAKVLLIDDEANKGWFEIFAVLLDDLNSASKVHLDYLGEDFKKLSQEEIINKSLDKIKEDDIDVVILDFRLNPNDFTSRRPEEVTSVKLLRKIKAYNPGIQVIVFSATDKVWNLQALQKAGADWFAHKDGGNQLKQTIGSFLDKLKTCVDKAIKLKPIYKSFSSLKKLSKYMSDDFKKRLENNLTISFELLRKSYEKRKFRNHAYLQLFLIIEEFLKEDTVFEFGDNCYVVTPNSRYFVLRKVGPNNRNAKNDPTYFSAIKWVEKHYKKAKSPHYRNIDTNFKMSSVLLFRYGLETSSERKWSQIMKTRNKKAAHPELETVDFDEINMIVKFLIYIFDESNIEPVDISCALKEPTLEEGIEALRRKWN